MLRALGGLPRMAQNTEFLHGGSGLQVRGLLNTFGNVDTEVPANAGLIMREKASIVNAEESSTQTEIWFETTEAFATKTPFSARGVEPASTEGAQDLFEGRERISFFQARNDPIV